MKCGAIGEFSALAGPKEDRMRASYRRLVREGRYLRLSENAVWIGHMLRYQSLLLVSDRRTYRRKRGAGTFKSNLPEPVSEGCRSKFVRRAETSAQQLPNLERNCKGVEPI